MARRSETHLYCDVCGRKGAQTWKVTTPAGERAAVDLCSRCDDPIRKAFVAGRRSVSGPVGVDAIRVTSEQEFLAWKKAQDAKHG